MASSEYAEICDINTVKSPVNNHSTIYEEIDNIPTPKERNIFGVQLKSSFHRTNRTSSRSSSNSDTCNIDVSSTKAGGSQSSSAEKKEEPIYAKPDKSKTLSAPSSNEIIENTKVDATKILQKSNKPPPSTPPPPPPTATTKHDTDTAKTNGSSTEQLKPQKKPENIVVGGNSEYSPIEDSGIKDKDIPADTGTSENNDDDHRYYLADSVTRDTSDNPAVSTGETEKVKDVTNSNDSKNVLTEQQSEPEVVIRNKHIEGAYEDIDTSQVVRRTRGSHVTSSFSEDGPDPLEGADNLRSSRNGRHALSGQTSASHKRQNFRGSKQAEEDDDDNNDVFANSDARQTSQTEGPYETVEYGANLKALVSSVVSSLEASDDTLESPDNGQAFLNLKQYLEKYADDGFDIDTHNVSSCNSIERLQKLLSP